MGAGERIVESGQDWRHSAMPERDVTSGIGPAVVSHTPGLSEVERFFTDTPEAATDEAQRRAGMAGANTDLRVQLAAHVAASPPAFVREAFGQTEGGPHA